MQDEPLNMSPGLESGAAAILSPAAYLVSGMDCPSCAAKIERAARSIPGVREASVSLVENSLTVAFEDGGECLAQVERAVERLGYGVARIGPSGSQATPGALPQPAPYRRALKIVAALNLGYGIAEMCGGFWTGSQALKADALDFLGDGSITLFGLAALSWNLAWRARAALAQGVFLGLFGAGVLANTAYRVFALRLPEAEMMGALGAGALAANLLCAALLLPHRSGETNVRAVWLFSRNDALGNLAVVAAAALVAWTGTPWPDLAAAACIALLFLHSAQSIVRDAAGTLRRA